MTNTLTIRRPYLWALAIACVAFVPSLYSRDIWPPLEARYAQVSREMAETGRILLPKINGELYPDKPPLTFWLAALLHRAGLGPQGGRAIAMLAAIGTVLVTGLMACRWFGPTAAWLAAVVLATTFEFAWIGRFGVPDPLLTFASTLAVWAWFAGGRATALFYVMLGVGVLAKAPVAILVPLLAILAARLARMASGPRARGHLLWGPPLTLAVIAAWLVPALFAGGKPYADELIGRHVLGRVVDSFSHRHHFFWYFQQLPGHLFPWLLVAIPGVAWAWRRGREERVLRMLLIWFVLGIGIFSLISSKRMRYLLPLYPVLALVVGRALEGALLSAEPGRWMRRLAHVQHVALLACGAGIIGLAFGAAKLFPLRPHVATALDGFPVGWAAGGLVLAAVGLLGARATRHGLLRRSVLLLVVECVALFWIVDLALVPRMNSFRTRRPVSERIDVLVPPESAGGVAIYPDIHHGAYNLYSRRLYLTHLTRADDVVRFLREPGRRLVLVHRGDFDRWRDDAGRTLAEALPEGLVHRATMPSGRTKVHLLANFALD